MLPFKRQKAKWNPSQAQRASPAEEGRGEPAAGVLGGTPAQGRLGALPVPTRPQRGWRGGGRRLLCRSPRGSRGGQGKRWQQGRAVLVSPPQQHLNTNKTTNQQMQVLKLDWRLLRSVFYNYLLISNRWHPSDLHVYLANTSSIKIITLSNFWWCFSKARQLKPVCSETPVLQAPPVTLFPVIPPCFVRAGTTRLYKMASSSRLSLWRGATTAF